MEIQLIARPASSSVSLKCPANGNPIPEIKWLKNGKTPERELQKEVRNNLILYFRNLIKAEFKISELFIKIKMFKENMFYKPIQSIL